MKWDSFVQAMLALLVIGAAVLKDLSSRRSSRRDQVRHDLELLQMLPDDSSARDLLAKHVTDSVLKLIATETTLRRDPSGIFLATTMILGAPAAAFFAHRAHGGNAIGLWVLFVALFVLGVRGLIESFPYRERDSKGNPIDNTKVDTTTIDPNHDQMPDGVKESEGTKETRPTNSDSTSPITRVRPGT
jgi:hypothetical protein